jgi:drug/metabolite transporter (DMT)-like permease
MKLFLAIVLAVSSAVCYAVSAALQHREAARLSVGGLGLMKALLHRRPWWAAVAVTVAGGVLHVSALGAGQLVLVQPIGVLALVFALPVGARLEGTRVTPRAWTGALCVVVGLPAALSAIPGHGAVGHAASSFSAAATVIVLLTGATTLAAVRTGRSHPRAAAVLYAIAAALCFGMTSGAAKTVLLGLGSPAIIAVGLAAAALGIVLTQHAYRDGGLGAPLAVLTLADPLTAATVGVIVLGEPLATAPLRVAVGLAGVVVTSTGVVLLTPPTAGRTGGSSTSMPTPDTDRGN